MAESNIITWNVPNWITILLMVALGFAIVGFVVKFVKQRKQQAAAA